MPPELAEVRAWLERARDDWNAARTLFDAASGGLQTVAFHCQQAAEKALKAYLVWRGAELERIHDLGRIVARCAAFDGEFEMLRHDVVPLTQYAVVSRYPGPPVPSLQEATRALAVVDRVWAFVTPRLPPEVVPSEPPSGT
jgi:HEPN domain-containing protein